MGNVIYDEEKQRLLTVQNNWEQIIEILACGYFDL